MNIGEKIRNAREDMDLLQSDMGRLIPMNQSNYSKIERGLQEPNLEQLKRICQILHLDAGYLLGLEENGALSSVEFQLLNDVKGFIKKYKDVR